MSTPDDAHNPIGPGYTAALIINSRSRRGERLARLAIRTLTAHGIAIAESHIAFHPPNLRDVVQRAVSHGHTLVIVGGGDGTFSSIVGIFAYQEVVLGLLPVGTGNSFARTLGIPLTLGGAVETIAHGKVAQVNLGKVNGLYFANAVDFGATVDATRSISWRLKQWVGPLAYLLVGARALLRHRPFRCVLRVEGQPAEEFDTFEVIVVNGTYYGHSKLTDQVVVTGDTLAVRTIDSPNRWQQFRLLLAFAAGNASTKTVGHNFTARELRVTTTPAQDLSIDGEIILQTPAHFTVAHQALKVMVPLTFDGG